MDFRRFVASRRQRGWSLAALGPNEARLLFDALVAGAAGVSSLLFLELLTPLHLDWRARVTVLALAPLFVAVNAAAGIYTRLKLASSRSKAAVLTASVAVSAALAVLAGAPASAAVLWGLTATGPIVAARLLLGLPFTRHSGLVSRLVINRHGPVVLLGGAGYIGCHAVDLLLEKGYHVRVLDRLMYGRSPIADFEGHPRFELIEGDVTDITKLTAALRNASAVVHLAGLVGDPACAVDQEFTRHTNVVATRMAKDVAQSLGVYRFVFASSCSVYGVSDDEVDESSALSPVSLYAQTKIDSERELLLGVADDFFVTVLRFATVFGHSRRPRFDLVANLFTAQAMTEGTITVMGAEQWRPFVHVRDLARAIVKVLEADPRLVQSQIFNVGDRRLNLTIGQLSERVREVVTGFGVNAQIVVRDQAAQDRRNYAVSFAKIRDLLGFEAATRIDDGVSEMVRQFQAGAYQHYRNEVYSNVATTRKAAEYFHDPLEAERLYAPLGAQHASPQKTHA
jgi:nucleoside-diphosphate-sugar epimerase